MGRRSIILLLMLCCSLPASGLTLVYLEQTNSDKVEHTISIEQAAGGYSIVVTAVSADGSAIIQTLETDGGFSVRSWKYEDREAGTDIVGNRESSHITLVGRYRGRALKRRFTVDSKPWYQLFPLGLEQLAVSQQRDTLFYAIGYEGIGAMRIGTFRAQPGQVEKIEWKDRLVFALRVRISLTGFASILWTGEYWIRPADGRNLVARSDRGPGTKPNVIELISER